MYLKRKLRTCTTQIHKEKNIIFEIFDFFSKGGPFDVKTDKRIFLIFQKFWKKIPQIRFMGPFKHKKDQSQ